MRMKKTCNSFDLTNLTESFLRNNVLMLVPKTDTERCCLPWLVSKRGFGKGSKHINKHQQYSTSSTHPNKVSCLSAFLLIHCGFNNHLPGSQTFFQWFLYPWDFVLSPSLSFSSVYINVLKNNLGLVRLSWCYGARLQAWELEFKPSESTLKKKQTRTKIKQGQITWWPRHD